MRLLLTAYENEHTATFFYIYQRRKYKKRRTMWPSPASDRSSRIGGVEGLRERNDASLALSCGLGASELCRMFAIFLLIYASTSFSLQKKKSARIKISSSITLLTCRSERSTLALAVIERRCSVPAVAMARCEGEVGGDFRVE